MYLSIYMNFTLKETESESVEENDVCCEIQLDNHNLKKGRKMNNRSYKNFRL